MRLSSHAGKNSSMVEQRASIKTSSLIESHKNQSDAGISSGQATFNDRNRQSFIKGRSAHNRDLVGSSFVKTSGNRFATSKDFEVARVSTKKSIKLLSNQRMSNDKLLRESFNNSTYSNEMEDKIILQTRNSQ
jgi:hypothetical protein